MARRKSRLLPLALSPAALAESLSLSERQVHAAIYRTGELPAYLINRRVRVTVDDALAWVKTFDRATVLNMQRRKRSPKS